MTITIGTSETGGTFDTQGAAIAALATRRGLAEPVALRRAETASVGNALGLEAGEIDFGFMAANWIGRAARGEAPFERPLDLRMAAPANAGPLFFVTTAATGLRAVGDLRGRRVAVGLERSGMTQHAITILGLLGIAFDEIEPAYLGFAAGADALAAGEVDAQFQCPIPNAVMTALAERADVRVLEYVPGALEAVIGAVPFYRRARIRAGALRGVARESAQVGVLNVIATHARIPAAKVGLLAGLMAEGAEALGLLNPLFDGLPALFDPLRREGEAGLAVDGVALHPGAVAAYRALGLIAG